MISGIPINSGHPLTCHTPPQGFVVTAGVVGGVLVPTSGSMMSLPMHSHTHTHTHTRARARMHTCEVLPGSRAPARLWSLLPL